MEMQDLLELVILGGVLVTRTAARVAETVLEWLFVAATWAALIVVGAVMACQRGGLPWVDPSDARATSTSAGSTTRRVSLR